MEDQTVTEKQPGKPVLALVLGIIGLFTWILPILGLPITATGLVYGINALKRQTKGLAVAAVVLCSVGLAASLGNCIWGVYLGVTGKHQLVNHLMKK